MRLRKVKPSSLPRLTRKELYSRLQLTPTINPIVEAAYKEVLRRQWRNKENDSPHGRKWHVSFHASQAPGNDPKACPRQALYRMMDLPDGKPPSRRLRLTAEAGKTLEVDMVTMLNEAGRLISAPPDAEVQTGFVVEEVMLTGTVDAAIEIKGRAVPVEIKTKHESDIAKMRNGQRGPDEKHVKQLKTQLGLVRAAQESGELWSDLKLCEYGYIYYMPRDTKYNPSIPIPTAEFYVEYDPDFFETGIEKLKQWAELWEEEILPSWNATKRHPLGFMWSKEPCKYCNYKKACKEDHKQGIDCLADSTAIEAAKEINPEYDYAEARNRVSERWT